MYFDHKQSEHGDLPEKQLFDDKPDSMTFKPSPFKPSPFKFDSSP
jgi:hypothetical protein